MISRGFELKVHVRMTGEREPTPADATELVQTALQTIFDDGYESKDNFFFDSFQIVSSTGNKEQA